MKDLEDFLWGFSIFSLALYFLRRLRKAISMASLTLTSPQSPSLPSPPSPLSWVSQFFLEKRKVPLIKDGSETTVPVHNQEDSSISQESQSCDMKRKGLHYEEKIMQESTACEAYQKGLHDKSLQKNSDVLIKKLGPDSLRIAKVSEKRDYNMGASKLKKRPGKLVVPEYCPKVEFSLVDRKLENKEFEVQGRDFFLASKKGRREVMEDGYGIMIDILGDAKQVCR